MDKEEISLLIYDADGKFILAWERHIIIDQDGSFVIANENVFLREKFNARISGISTQTMRIIFDSQSDKMEFMLTYG
jgi:hypothetical protein